MIHPALTTSLLTEALTRFDWQRRKEQVAPTIERRLALQMADGWKQQRRLFLDHFESLKPIFPRIQESALREVSGLDILPLWDLVTNETRPEMVTAIQEAVEAGLLAGGTSVMELLGGADFGISFKLEFPEAVAYLDNYGAARITGIDATTRKEIQGIVSQAASEGWSWQRTADIIGNQFESFYLPARGGPSWFETRAQLVAVTEVGQAYEEGSWQSAKRLQAAGLAMEKAWSGPNDDQTSAACLGNIRAGWIGMDEAFPSGDMTPLNHPGCRHTAIYRRKRQ